MKILPLFPSSEFMDFVEEDTDELKGLLPIMIGWSPDGWMVEDINKKKCDQMRLF